MVQTCTFVLNMYMYMYIGSVKISTATSVCSSKTCNAPALAKCYTCTLLFQLTHDFVSF